MKGYQEAELTYTRSGYDWHRVAPGTPFVPHGGLGQWDGGNLQCASQPVFLDDEIRYYYVGTDMAHENQWELQPQTAGLGFARMKPDRFVALEAGESVAELLTVSFVPEGSRLLVNAIVRKDGWVKVAVLDPEGREIAGLSEGTCVPVTGDSTGHAVRWAGGADIPTRRPIRLRLRAMNAQLFSVFVIRADEPPVYYRFSPLW